MAQAPGFVLRGGEYHRHFALEVMGACGIVGDDDGDEMEPVLACDEGKLAKDLEYESLKCNCCEHRKTCVDFPYDKKTRQTRGKRCLECLAGEASLKLRYKVRFPSTWKQEWEDLAGSKKRKNEEIVAHNADAPGHRSSIDIRIV